MANINIFKHIIGKITIYILKNNWLHNTTRSSAFPEAYYIRYYSKYLKMTQSLWCPNWLVFETDVMFANLEAGQLPNWLENETRGLSATVKVPCSDKRADGSLWEGKKKSYQRKRNSLFKSLKTSMFLCTYDNTSG